MIEQHTHTTTSFPSKKFPIIVVCDGVQSPANVGGLFRICEALGVSEIVFCNADIKFDSKRLLKTSRNTTSKVSYRISEDIIEDLQILRKLNYKIIGLELTNTSIPIKALSLSKEDKIVLVIGGENHGISPNVLQEIVTCVHISMHGTNSSMNVIQATGIAIHTLIPHLY